MTNLVDLVIFSLLSGLAAGVLSFARHIVGLLLFNVDVTDDQAYSTALGSIISKHGWCSGKRIQPRIETPCDGWHWLPKYRVLVNKTSQSNSHGFQSFESSAYKIIGLKWQKRQLEQDILKICEGEHTRANQIPNVYVETVPFAWRPTQRTKYLDTLDASLWTHDQRSITKMVVKQFLNNSRASVLVAGEPNTGKSTLADTIATYLLTEHGITATIIHGMSPSRPIGLGFIRKKPTRQNPHIYLINEVDTAVNKALSDKENKKEETTYADNKTSLNDYMDRCAKDNDVIRIFTTNEISLVTDLEGGNNTERNVFFREGRVDFRSVMTQHVGANSNFITPSKQESKIETPQKHTMILRSANKKQLI